MLNNSRIEAGKIIDSLNTNTIFVVDKIRSWQKPPTHKKYIKISNLNEIPKGAYLLIAGHDTYLYSNYFRNQKYFLDSDWYPIEKPIKRIELHEKILELKPYDVIESKNLFFFDNIKIPYDIWYMTHPNYYLYRL